MPQYSQRHWQLALILLVLLFVGCSSNEPIATVVNVESIASDASANENASASGDLVVDDSPSGSAFEDIYSSFTQEMEVDVSSVDDETGKPTTPPIEYLYEISGGADSMAGGLPSWVTGDRFMKFIDPVAFAFYQDEMYILDAGRHVLFKYAPDGQELFSKMNLKDYLNGSPAGLAFDSQGYYYVSDPVTSRVLKFNPSNLLVGVYNDKANLSSPGRLFYHESSDRLYISDRVYSRIMVSSRYGKLRFAIGSRGEMLGEFIKITDFAVIDNGMYIADRLGKMPLQLLDNEGGFQQAIGRDQVGIPGAIAVDKAGRLYVADQDDDTIRIFVNQRLSWSVGGSGRLPGQFRGVSQMMVHQDKLFVLDALNRRIQVFRVND